MSDGTSRFSVPRGDASADAWPGTGVAWSTPGHTRAARMHMKPGMAFTIAIRPELSASNEAGSLGLSKMKVISVSTAAPFGWSPSSAGTAPLSRSAGLGAPG